LETVAWWRMCIFVNCDLFFPAFVGSLFSIKHFQAKLNGNIFCSGSGFRDKILYIKGENEQEVSSLILFVFLKYNSCLLLYML